MRKLLLIVAAFAAGCAFADRTANRDWIGRNFAPSNLVPRVEALEGEVPPVESVNGRTGEVVLVAGDLNAYTKTQTDAAIAAKVENDPRFTAWTNGVTVAVGKGATVTSHGATAVGPYATAKGQYAVALGCESWAQGDYAVQLGSGYNTTPGTLQFGEWTLLDANGKIPKARFPSDTGSIPTSSDQMVSVGPLVINAEPVLLALGAYKVGDPWDKSTWGLDSGCAYSEGSWTFSDGWDNVVNISPDGITVYGDGHLTFVNGTQWVSFPDKVKSLVTPAVVLEKIKAMNATQKAELKAFLGIQ